MGTLLSWDSQFASQNEQNVYVAPDLVNVLLKGYASLAVSRDCVSPVPRVGDNEGRGAGEWTRLEPVLAASTTLILRTVFWDRD